MKTKTYIGWLMSPGDWFAPYFVAMLERYNPEFQVRDVTHLSEEARFVLLFEVWGADMHSANTAIVQVSGSMRVDPYGKALTTNTVWLKEELEIQVPTRLPACY